jgi:hypothetical protein
MIWGLEIERRKLLSGLAPPPFNLLVVTEGLHGLNLVGRGWELGG